MGKRSISTNQLGERVFEWERIGESIVQAELALRQDKLSLLSAECHPIANWYLWQNLSAQFIK